MKRKDIFSTRNRYKKERSQFLGRFVSEILVLFEDEWDVTIVPDCRFPNEIEVMRGLFDTFTVRVNRLNFISPLTEQQHQSEIALDNYQFDYYLDSESGLDNLRKEVVKLYNYIKLSKGNNR